MDDFSGDNYDPPSLHKYLYAHCNPINNIDPSGMFSFTLSGVISAISIGIAALSIGFKAYRIGMGFKSLIFLNDLAMRLARTSLDAITQIQIRNHMYRLAVSIIGDMGQTFASIISEVLLDIGIAIAAVALIATVSGLYEASGISVKLSKFVNARKMAKVRKLGRAGEEAAEIVAKKGRIDSLTKTANYRIADELTEIHLREVKNRAYVGMSNQIKDFLAHCKKHKLDFILDVRKTTKTKISKPLLELEEAGVIIIRRYL